MIFLNKFNKEQFFFSFPTIKRMRKNEKWKLFLLNGEISYKC